MDTQIQHLPCEVGCLTALQRLYLSNNPSLRVLPKQLLLLTPTINDMHVTLPQQCLCISAEEDLDGENVMYFYQPKRLTDVCLQELRRISDVRKMILRPNAGERWLLTTFLQCCTIKYFKGARGVTGAVRSFLDEKWLPGELKASLLERLCCCLPCFVLFLAFTKTELQFTFWGLSYGERGGRYP